MAKRAPKKARAKSPAKKHGGARAGAGRKRDRLPQAVVAKLGEVPEDATGLDLWVRKALAELVVLVMTGEVSPELAASIRATCGEIRRNLPDAPPVNLDDQDDDDTEVEGPELEEVSADGALRVQP
ncbi:MAG: hypothetical protein M3619_00685 [Myxococcota bacterium]|nr:hypothetical protein [Myxococcota bacterium]